MKNFTDEEKHCLLIGFMEVLCPWPSRYKVTEEAEFKPDVQHHYYLTGRGLGFIVLMFVLVAIVKLAQVLFW